MMHNYGKIHPSTHPNNSSFIMRLMYPNLHNSFITFRIDATDLRFVVNAGKGRIVSAESRGFTKSTKTAGEVVVRVENLAEVSQDFNVVLTKCFGRDQLPSKRVSLYPGETETVIFALLGRNKGKITTECEGKWEITGSGSLVFLWDLVHAVKNALIRVIWRGSRYQGLIGEGMQLFQQRNKQMQVLLFLATLSLWKF